MPGKQLEILSFSSRIGHAIDGWNPAASGMYKYISLIKYLQGGPILNRYKWSYNSYK